MNIRKTTTSRKGEFIKWAHLLLAVVLNGRARSPGLYLILWVQYGVNRHDRSLKWRGGGEVDATYLYRVYGEQKFHSPISTRRAQNAAPRLCNRQTQSGGAHPRQAPHSILHYLWPHWLLPYLGNSRICAVVCWDIAAMFVRARRSGERARPCRSQHARRCTRGLASMRARRSCIHTFQFLWRIVCCTVTQLARLGKSRLPRGPGECLRHLPAASRSCYNSPVV